MPAIRPFHLVLVAVLASGAASAANPLRVVGETFVQWKHRLFGEGPSKPAIVDAPATGPVALLPGRPQRIAIGEAAPERDFPDGRSRYRIVELPSQQAAVALRVQVIARDNPDGRGNAVFKPMLYVLGEDDGATKAVEVKPMHVDIRPFKPTRLLGCAKLENVRADGTRVVALDGEEVVDVRLEARGGQRAPQRTKRLDLLGRACDGNDVTAGLPARG